MTEIRARWEWALYTATGEPLAGRSSPAFTQRFDAESWLGERWRDLAAAGAGEARLLHDGVVVPPAIPLPAALD